MREQGRWLILLPRMPPRNSWPEDGGQTDQWPRLGIMFTSKSDELPGCCSIAALIGFCRTACRSKHCIAHQWNVNTIFSRLGRIELKQIMETWKEPTSLHALRSPVDLDTGVTLITCTTYNFSHISEASSKNGRFQLQLSRKSQISFQGTKMCGQVLIFFWAVAKSWLPRHGAVQSPHWQPHILSCNSDLLQCLKQYMRWAKFCFLLIIG